MFCCFNARALGLSMTATRTVEIAARAGFGGVDLLVRDLLALGEDPRDLRRRMDAAGLRGGAWPLPVDWRGDPDRFRDDLAALPRYAEAAARLGLSGSGTWIRPERRVGSTHDHDLAWHLDRLGAIAEVLSDHGQSLGLEIIGVRSSRPGLDEPFLASYHTLTTILNPLRERSTNVGVLLDLFHVHAAGDELATLLANPEFGPITWVHVADLPAGHDGDLATIRDEIRGLPGESGLVPLADGLQRLARASFVGPVTVEPLQERFRQTRDDEMGIARRTLDAFQGVRPRVDDPTIREKPSPG
jgi:sugar phosphate isomerase/epimerase